MTDDEKKASLPRIRLYCAGHPDNNGNPTHEPFDFDPFVRIAPGTWLPIGQRDANGRKLKQADRIYRMRFKCPRCKYDERRRVDLTTRDRIDIVLERFFEIGWREISVRAFVDCAWPG